MAYISLTDLRGWIGLDSNFVRDDAKLTACVTAAEALVDAYCGRDFVAVVTGDDAPDPSARVFEASDATEVYVDDLGTEPSDIVVRTSSDRSTWTTLDDGYIFPGPLRVLSKRIPEPYTCLEVVGTGGYFLRYVEVTTAAWGWPETPREVKTAALLIAHWLVRRPGDPYAVTSIGELPSRLAAGDPDVRRLLAPYRRMDRVAGIA